MRRRLALAAPLLLACGCAEVPYDLVVRGGRVLDGQGSPATRTDIGVVRGKVVKLGDLGRAPATRVIDAHGLTVAPGFIDIHNHSDYTILLEPDAQSMIRQGVTTMVLGEGESAGPVKPGVHARRVDEAEVDWTTLGEYFAKLQRRGVSTNVASYVGQGQVWTYVKGYAMTPATPAEIEQMKKLVDRKSVV